jgi:hypothetical protein
MDGPPEPKGTILTKRIYLTEPEKPCSTVHRYRTMSAHGGKPKFSAYTVQYSSALVRTPLRRKAWYTIR